MSENTNKSFLNIIYKNRKWIILCSFFIFFVIVILSSYCITYNKTKINAYSSTKNISESKLSDFDIDFYATYYAEPNKDDDTQDLTFSFSISNAASTETYKYSAIKASATIGDKHWTKRKLAGTEVTVKSSITSSNASATSTLTIKNYAYSYPVRKMLFVKINHPTVWLNINYTKTSIDGQHSYSRNYTIKYSWSNYYISGKTVLG